MTLRIAETRGGSFRPWLGWMMLGRMVFILAALPALLGTAPASAQSANDDGVSLSVLTPADIERYQRIFELQRDARWAEADREIRRLNDKILLGHVQHQRYSYPNGYKPSYRELADWLGAYADHPGAEDFFSQARRLKPPKEKAPHSPVAPHSGDFPPEIGDVAKPRPSGRVRDAESARIIAGADSQIVSAIRKGQPSAAEKILERPDLKGRLGAAEFDEWRTRIAAGYFYHGDDTRAFQLASAAAKRSRTRVTDADWIAGLSAWRLGQYDQAGHHFEQLAHSQSASIWDQSAGAWWASRVMLKLRQPEEVTRLLKLGAAQERTFYGLLCMHALGLDLPFQWEPPPLAAEEAKRLLSVPAVKRAVALNEAGEYVRAEREVARLFSRASDPLSQALLSLTSRMQTPASSMKIALAWRSNKGDAFDGALYPLPPWQPDGGFALDRALIFAFMRQESAFNARAMSPVGASGLMQLMPKTASLIARDTSLSGKGSRHRLFAPEYNIELGQRYIQHLLEQGQVKGNLFYAAAAYNAGPGNLQKWLRETRYDGDPLLFIESIPVSETRNFIERVLANYWIYRTRLNQPQDALNAVTGGGWPLYRAHDK